MGLELVILGDINPNFTGLLIPDSKLEKPDIVFLLLDVPEEVSARVRIAADESYTENCRWVQALDSKLRGLYTTTAGLVNDGMEVIRGYGMLTSALDLRISPS